MSKVPRYRERFVPIGQVAGEARRLAAPESMQMLLADPAGVLLDPERWPSLDDLWRSSMVLRGTYLDWLADRARLAGGAWAIAPHWRPEWGSPGTPESRALNWIYRHDSPGPLPGGKTCPEWQGLSPGAPLRELVPFNEDVHTMLVLSFTAGSTSMDVFFLMELGEMKTMIGGEWHDLPWWVGWRPSGEVRRVVHGEPEVPPISDVWDACRAWWGDVSGSPLKRNASRPKGSGEHRELAPFLDALCFYRDHLGTERPTIDDLYRATPKAKLEFLDQQWKISKKTLVRRLDEWGLDWDEVVDMVWGR